MNFLLEIGCEELPVSFIKSVLIVLKNNFTELLDKHGIHCDKMETYATPRRLALIIENISPQSQEKLIEIKGPPKKVAFDNSGNPTRALQGFLQNNQAAINEVQIKDINGNDYVFVTQKCQPMATYDILKDNISGIILSLKARQNMRWECEDISFSRPIRWLVALLNKQVVQFNLAQVTSGNVSQGHRFFGTQIVVDEPMNYLSSLKEVMVIVDHNERKALIKSQLNSAINRLSAIYQEDEDLLEEVTHLVEFPQVIVGKVPAEFMALPEPLVITTIKHHLKAFPFYNNQGKLLPFFGIVTNQPAGETSLITSGYEQVAQARLRDTYFFFNADVLVPIESWVNNLNQIVFFKGLGSLKDKNNRLLNLSKSLGDLADRSLLEDLPEVLLKLKFEQTTAVVKEFPELESQMAEIYALNQKEKPEIAQALSEHYFPKNITDNPPLSQLGKWSSVLDRIDTLVGIFASGHRPTGSEDPFALRRIALGLIRNLISMEQEINLSPLIEKCLTEYRLQGIKINNQIINEIITFIQLRLESYWLEEGFKYDIVQAILNNSLPANLKFARDKIIYLEEHYETESFLSIVLAFKRIHNILKPHNLTTEGVLDTLLTEEEEIQLWEKVKQTNIFLEQNPLASWLSELSQLVYAINMFFDAVLVNVDDEKVRNNRIHLLNTTLETISRLGNLNYINKRR